MNPAKNQNPKPKSGAVAIIIPARYDSTRFPGKPLHVIAGKPLIQHVWERCRKVRLAETVIVATDDMRIAEKAFAFGAEVAITSRRHQSGTDRVAEVARKLRSISHVINVQGDEPLIDPALIRRLAGELLAEPSLEMITAAALFQPDEDAADPNAVKVVFDRNRNALYFSRSLIPYTRGKQRPAAHYRHHGIYGYSTKFLLEFVKWKPTAMELTEQLEQLRALDRGTGIRVIVTKSRSIGVDSPADADKVARLLTSR